MKNFFQKLLVGYLVLTIVYWVILHLSGKVDTNQNYFYSFAFSLMPLVGGFIGMLKAGIWGGLKSHLGKAVFFISTGLFLWGAGSMVFSYYNIVAHVPAPYPSLADIGFALSIPFWAIGAIYLSKASGARFGLKSSRWAKVATVLIPIVVLTVSWYLLVRVARGGVLVPPGESALKLVLDVAYPLGDVISLTLAAIIFGLSFKFFGGLYKISIMAILLGLALMYFGDFVFSYTTTVGTFFVGDWGDFLLSFGLFFLTFGVLGFASKPQNQVAAPAKAA